MFGDVLSKAMSVRNVSQKELMSKTGIAQETLSRYTSGVKLPPYKDILSISDALEVDPAIFFPHASYTNHYIKSGIAVNNSAKIEQLVYPFKCGIMYSVFIDDNSLVSQLNIKYGSAKTCKGVCMMCKNGHVKSETYIKVMHGCLRMFYSNGGKEINKGELYKVIGYETEMEVDANTEISIFISGYGYDGIRKKIEDALDNSKDIHNRLALAK